MILITLLTSVGNETVWTVWTVWTGFVPVVPQPGMVIGVGYPPIDDVNASNIITAGTIQ